MTSPLSPLKHTRREFLRQIPAAALALGSCHITAKEASATPETNGFFLVGDTHFAADETDISKMDPVSKTYNTRLVEWLNRLPGTEFSAEAGGGKVPQPHGVIHAGDIVENGDKGGRYVDMVPTEWAAFETLWGLNGTEGKLRWPVREVHGNHDSPRGEGLPIKEIMARNKRRQGVKNVSDNGLHYSWDWGNIHLVALGLIVGETKEVTRRRRYGALDSLAFLQSDLASAVGDSGRPVVIVHHIDLHRYSVPVADDVVKNNEWDYADVQAYHKILEPHRVAALCCGHTHTRNLTRWDGSGKPVEKGGHPFLNTDNAAHFKSQTQAFLHVTVDNQATTVREFATKDGWETGAWTPQAWKFDFT